MEKEYDSHPLDVIDAFKLCITQIPMKLGAYATLTSLLNVKMPALGKEIVEMAQATLMESVAAREFRNAKLLVILFVLIL